MVAIGLVITFVGLGEKGFKTVEMKLVGPGLVVGGLVLALLRILCCLICTDYKCSDDYDDEHEVSSEVLEIFNDDQEKTLLRNGLPNIKTFKLKDQVVVNLQPHKVGDCEEGDHGQLVVVGQVDNLKEGDNTSLPAMPYN